MIGTIIKLMYFKPFKGRVAGPEDELAIEVASFLRASTLEGKLEATWTCIPHEVGGVSQKSAIFRVMQARYAKQIAMGLITGSGDYVFVWKDGGGWMELKSKTGSLSPQQRLFRDWCLATGTRWVKCKSLDEVRVALREWGVLT